MKKTTLALCALLLWACDDDDGDATAGDAATPDAAEAATDAGNATDTGATDAAIADAALPDAAQPEPWAACPVDQIEFRQVDVGEVTLNTACVGTGQTVLLLHGFPEFWFGWSRLMGALGTDLQLVVPDQRGYNLSDKPEGLEPYQVPHLVADMVGLIDALGETEVVVVGHDWGGIVAWTLAAVRPERVSKLIIMNGPHPTVFAREIAENPEQRMASAYIQFFLGEGADATLSANNFAALADAIFTDAFTEEERVAYLEAWGQPGALTAMLNWYRANLAAGAPSISEVPVVEVPTLVLWGLADEALLAGNIEGLDEYVTDLEVQTFDDATHWIAHEIPDELAAAVRTFIEAD